MRLAHRTTILPHLASIAAVVCIGAPIAGLGCGSTAPQAPAKAATKSPDTPVKATATAKTKDINARFMDEALDTSVWAGRFEREQREVYAHRAQLVKAAAVQAGQTVVDVGAGSGAFLEPMSVAVGPNGRVQALDISPRFVEFMSKRVKQNAWTNVTVQQSLPDDIQVAAATADVVFVCDTYHHFTNPQSVLASIFKALKPGGRLVIVDFHRIPGKTKKWLMEHVRAGQEVFASEITAAGFVRQADPPHPFLVENYLMVFTRP